MPAPFRDLDFFTTARLCAERLAEHHYRDILAMHQDPDHMAFLGGVRDESQTRGYLDVNLRHWDRYGHGVWMLRDHEGALCGRTLLRHLDIEGVDEVETGYSFNPAYWGRGLATEITLACIELGATRLGLVSVIAITRPEHAASRRVMEKAGMRYERDVAHASGTHVLYRSSPIPGQP